MPNRHDCYNRLSMKEILLDWINIYIPSSYYIGQDNYSEYLGDIEGMFVNLWEYSIRKSLLEKYLENPTEETIEKFLSDLKRISNSSVLSIGNSQKRAVYKVLNRFKHD